MPVERQITEPKDYGVSVSAGSIFGGMKKLYSLYLEPLYNAMKRNIREAEHLHADETRWKLFVKLVLLFQKQIIQQRY